MASASQLHARESFFAMLECELFDQLFLPDARRPAAARFDAIDWYKPRCRIRRSSTAHRASARGSDDLHP
jgi:hypothetical protein